MPILLNLYIKETILFSVMESSSVDKETFLNDTWNVFFHDPFNSIWTNNSYVFIDTISTIEDTMCHLHYQHNNIHKGMFFIMRDGIYPCWDDPNNINGGVLSLKVLKEDVAKFWHNLLIRIVGETILIKEKREHWNLINGISISPKKYFCIVKIWIKDNSLFDKSFYNLPDSYHGDVLFKLNLDNIQNSQAGN